VLGRREDGYHRLQTLFQFHRLWRLARFHSPRRWPDSAVDGDARVSAAASHLSVRAARQLQEATDCTLGVDLSLDKRLPLGGGLGGGSSDAATTLVALNRIWGTGLSEDELAALGLALGADVPVFVRGRAAWGEGVGEHLTPVEVPEPWYLVLAPACVVSTADVFADPELTRNSPSIKIADFLAGDDRNDCQDLVRVCVIRP
jgi:4-diphosphocytidyl-2-C-methyl-D-erythritol kinase